MPISRNFPFPLLLDHLPQVFSNQTPRALRRFSRNPAPAWRLAEEAVYWFFRYHMSLSTIRFGANTLFRHEPEGLISGIGPARNRAMIYECKCRREAYMMTHDDLLRYGDYVVEKREQVRSMHLTLTNFLIIAPGFRGSYQSKLAELSTQGVSASGITGDFLMHLYHEVEDWKLERIQLLDLNRLLVPGLVGLNRARQELRRVNQQYRGIIG